jgi:ATP-binding cassette, subfamily B, bacterial
MYILYDKCIAFYSEIYIKMSSIKNNIKCQFNFAKDIFWLFGIVWKKYKLSIVLLVIVSTLIALVSLFQAFSNGYLVDVIVNAVKHQDRNINIILAFILVGASLIVPSFLYIIQNFLERRVYFFLTKTFDLMLIEKRIDLDIQQYEDSEFNNFVNRVNEKGIFIIGNFLTNLFFDYQSIITVIFSSFIIARQSLTIFFIIFIFSMPELIVSMIYGKRGWYIWGDVVDAEDRRKYWSIKGFVESLSSLTEIKLFGLRKKFTNLIDNSISKVEEKQNQNERSYLIKKVFTTILSQTVLLGTVIFFVEEAIAGRIEVGTVIFLFGGMVGFQNSLTALFTSIGKQQEDRLYIHDVSTFLKTKSIIKDGTENLHLDICPEIQFENVSFSYPNTQRKVFESLSLTIKPGEKLALVGLNGAGKTTLIKLLCRFYNPQEGKVLIDKKDLKDIKIHSWYDKIGILFQDFAKFDFPKVGDLVSFGRVEEEYNKDKVIDSIKKADAVFVESWNNKYDQQLGKTFKDGIEPSGGQWQKLAIARLFYRDSKILILDEPTSSVDASAEAKIFESLEALPKDKTVILISHRFSTVRNADRIVVINEGKVIENGTHEELVAINGEYAKLFNLQAEGYK